MIAVVAMEDAGFIFASYALTLGAMAAYAWRVLRRAKRVAPQVRAEDRPWT